MDDRVGSGTIDGDVDFAQAAFGVEAADRETAIALAAAGRNRVSAATARFRCISRASQHLPDV